jgi:chromosome partitioning protein
VPERGIGLALIDLGPNLGPLNRAALLAADHIVLPIAPDLFSLQGLENFGPALVDWRKGWRRRVEEYRDQAETQSHLSLPAGRMEPVGYVLMSFGVRDNRPVKAYDNWTEKIPETYRSALLQEGSAEPLQSSGDPYQLAALKHYRSLMPMAMTARKPMFLLQSADGARGSHLDAVKKCYGDFLRLAQEIGRRVGIPVS